VILREISAFFVNYYIKTAIYYIVSIECRKNVIVNKSADKKYIVYYGKEKQ